MDKQKGTRFIRVRGRIVPVKQKSGKGDKVAGAAIGGLGAANVAAGAYLAKKGASNVSKGTDKAGEAFQLAVKLAKGGMGKGSLGYEVLKKRAQVGAVQAVGGVRQGAIGAAGVAIGTIGLMVGRQLWKGKK